MEFVNGLSVYKPNDRAPEFVKGKLYIKPQELIEFLQEKTEPFYVDVLSSKKDETKWYGVVNTFKNTSKEAKEVFWNKETLACIFTATFLIWWGKETNNDNYITHGLNALKQIKSLQDKN